MEYRWFREVNTRGQSLVNTSKEEVVKDDLAGSTNGFDRQKRGDRLPLGPCLRGSAAARGWMRSQSEVLWLAKIWGWALVPLSSFRGAQQGNPPGLDTPLQSPRYYLLLVETLEMRYGHSLQVPLLFQHWSMNMFTIGTNERPIGRLKALYLSQRLLALSCRVQDFKPAQAENYVRLFIA
jgi:hypothetical protein